MTWSYNPSMLKTSAKDVVRLLIGDVVDSDQQLQNEEIVYLISTRGTLYGAAAECCRSLQAKFSRSVDQKAGTSQIKYSQMAQAYGRKVIEFEEKSTMSGSAIPYGGGISLTEKQIAALDTDRIPPVFNIGMMDNNLPAAQIGNEPRFLGSESE